MLLPRLQPPLRAAVSSIGRSGTILNSQACLSEAFAKLSVCTGLPSLIQVRHASHAQQGAVNKAKDGPGKRLGAKKSGEQYVIPGNIIFRQRGTHWFPGDNCAMGRDHTIYATECGYVKYYKDPEKHPKRQYIGVVFERDQVLPLPRNSVRRRRLGMVTQKIGSDSSTPTLPGLGAKFADLQEVEVAAVSGATPELKRPSSARKLTNGERGRNLTLRPGYMYRESNWEIGRAAEKAHISVREFKPGDRWAAWRKSTARKTKNAEKRGLSKRTKKK